MLPSSTAPRQIIRRMIAGLIIGFVVIVILAIAGDIRQVEKTVLAFNWHMYPLVLLLTLFNYALRFIKFHYYLRLIGASNITWLQSMRLFVAGFPLAVTPGKVGEALKGAWISQLSDVSVGRGISVVVAERISDGLAVLLLSIAGVIAYPQYWLAFLAVFFFLIAIVALSQMRPAALFLLALAGRIPIVKRFSGGLHEFYEGSFWLFRPLPTLLAVGLGAISWLGEGLGFYLILVGLGMTPGVQLAALAVFILSFSTVVGAVSALPGGLGAAEVSIAGMLALLAGAEAALASTATLLIRMATLWFGVSLGLAVWSFSLELLGLKHTRSALEHLEIGK